MAAPKILRDLHRSSFAVAIAAAFMAAPALAASGDASSPPFQVNPAGTSASGAVVGRAGDGRFVVVWVGNGELQGRLFEADGTPRAAPFAISAPGALLLRWQVAMDSSGDFVATWQQLADDGLARIMARAFDPDGGARSAPKVVVEAQPLPILVSRDVYSDVAIDPDGDFVVAWQSINQTFLPGVPPYGVTEIGGSTVKARRFQADGTPLSTTVTVDSSFVYPRPISGGYLEIPPAVAIDAAGDFTVVWQTQAVVQPAIFGRKIGANNVPQGLAFRVDPPSLRGGLNPKVAMDDNGDFVVTWSASHPSGAGFSGYDVYARRYAAKRIAGPVVKIDDNIAIAPASIAMNASGNAVIAWPSTSSDFCCEPRLINAQILAPDGSKLGPNLTLNQGTDNVDVGIDADGNFVIVWDGFGTPLRTVNAQLFSGH